LIKNIQKINGDRLPILNNNALLVSLHTFSTMSYYQPDEFSWHATYSYNFNEIGFPGLKASVRYLKGHNISRANFKDNNENEYSAIVSYIIPEGTLKGLGFEWRYFNAQREYDQGYTSGVHFQENRFITSYTYNF